VPERTVSRLPLSERLRPSHLKDLVGNARAKSDLRAWADAWESAELPGRRVAVLSGPAGVGKTSAALALANDFGWTVIEMNASDARNERAINQVAGRASITHTLDDGSGTGRRRRALILLDEADCLTGRLTETAPAKSSEPPPLRDFLRGRYGTVDALNAAYGLRPKGRPAPFEDWDSVPRSPGNAAWARLTAARRDIEEWRSGQKTVDLSDRGGLGAIARLVRATRQPVVLTVNDERVLTRYSPIFRSAVARIHFSPVRDTELRSRLDEVARSERIRLAPGAIDAIVRRARGDVRAAMNDLDAIAPLEPGPLQLSVLAVRDLASDFAQVTEEVLTTPRFYRSVEIQDRLDSPPDDLLPWIEENLPHFAPDAARRAAGFDVLAVAERFLARARRARVWSQWSYASELLTGGVGLALRDRASPPLGSAGFPQFLGEMGRTRGMRATRDALAGKLGKRFHLSRAKARETLLPFLESIFPAARALRGSTAFHRTGRAIARELELTPEELGLLMRMEPDSREVRSLLETRTADGEEPIPPPSPREARPRQRQLSEFGA
jgi:DNA polymerase III delta prime subunit